MIKCLVIDDEPLALQQLLHHTWRRYLTAFTLVAQCHGAVEAREIIDMERVDAIFVDINMPDINGMDFVKQLSAPPIVVFTTAYSGMPWTAAGGCRGLSAQALRARRLQTRRHEGEETLRT